MIRGIRSVVSPEDWDTHRFDQGALKMVRARADAEGATEFDRFWGLRPRLYELFLEEYNKAVRRVDPVIFELCRLRMAQTFESDFDLAMRYRPAQEAGLTEQKIAALSSYFTSPLYSERERACIAFAEQFAIQSSSISDEDCTKLQEHLSPKEFVLLTKALGKVDQFQRCCAAVDIRFEGTVPPTLDNFVPASVDGRV
jgi:alkylhydroperoxidase family enzyme